MNFGQDIQNTDCTRVFAQFQTFGQSQELENLLRQGNLTLEELMNRDNFLFDIKAGALGAFTEFLAKHPENFEKMLLYITQTNVEIAEDDVDDLKYKKYPYILSEIFAIDNSSLLDFLFVYHKSESQKSFERLTTIEDDILPEYQHEETQEEDQSSQSNIISGTSIQYVTSFQSRTGVAYSENIRIHLLSIFFKYLEAEKISETSMGYYAKILNQIIKKYGVEIWDYIINNTNILGNLLRHLNHGHIVDIIVKMIVFEQRPQETNQFINMKFYNQRKQLLDALIKQLDEEVDNLMIENLCQIFITLLEYGNEHKLYEYLRELYDLMLKPQLFFEIGRQTSLHLPFKTYYMVLFFIFSNGIKDQKTAQVIKSLQSMKQVIEKNISQNGFVNTFGKNQTNLFGQSNLELILAIEVMIKLKNPLILESLFQQDYFNQLLAYLTQYQWNNQLQVSLQHIFINIIQDDRYVQRILKDTNLLSVLNKYLSDNPQTNEMYLLIQIILFLDLNPKPLVMDSWEPQNKYPMHQQLSQMNHKNIQQYQQNVNLFIYQCIDQFINQLLETINVNLEIETQFLCKADPKTHMEEAPPEISIDRQVEMMLDKQNDQLNKQQQQQQQQQQQPQQDQEGQKLEVK